MLTPVRRESAPIASCDRAGVAEEGISIVPHATVGAVRSEASDERTAHLRRRRRDRATAREPDGDTGRRASGRGRRHHALDGDDLRSFDGRVIPRAIFTDPPIGIVGMTEAEAIAAGHRCWCATIPMELVPRGDAIRNTRGLIKMVADADSKEVRGVSMVGTGAPEVIHEAAMAMRFRATLDDLIDQLNVYPTMAEALKIVACDK